MLISLAAQTETPAEVADRVSARTRSIRKRRVIRSLLLFVLSVTVMCLLVIATRDSQARRAAESEARTFASVLQEQYQKTGRPATFAPEGAGRAGDRYAFNPFYPELLATHGSVGVIAPSEPLRLFLGGTGRYVVIFDGRMYTSRWMSESEFQRQSGQLGFERGL